VLTSLYYRARHIDAVELNPVTWSLVKDKYARYDGHLAQNKHVNWVNGDGRSYLARSSNPYQLVWFLAPDTYAAANAATVAAHALSEKHYDGFLRAAREGGMAAVCETAAAAFSELGCAVENASPEIGAILEPFMALNASVRIATVGKYLDQWREQMDPFLVRRLELGRSLTPDQIGQAEVARSAYHQRLRRFFEKHDLLVLPATATAATPLDALKPKEVAGRPVGDHLDLLVLTLAFNFSAYPAISVPCGQTRDGLPVGLQIAGGWRQDALVLRAAAAFEAARPWDARRPPLN